VSGIARKSSRLAETVHAVMGAKHGRQATRSSPALRTVRTLRLSTVACLRIRLARPAKRELRNAGGVWLGSSGCDRVCP
jgi:hypothetical protein